jgi:hypothetical protein
MDIRLAELADLPRIVELSNRAGAETTANIATSPNVPAFAHTSNRKLCGSAISSLDSGSL